METMTCPAWPTSVPRVMRKAGNFRFPVSTYSQADVLAMEQAKRILDREARKRCSVSYQQTLFTRSSDFSALASFTSEASLLSGNQQPTLWKPIFDFNQINRQIRLWGKGVLSSTSTPNYTFQFRMGSAQASLAGASIGVSPAIVTASSITNQMFEFCLDMILTTTVGLGSGNTTVTCAGWIKSPGGFAAPYEYSLIPSQGSLATWTATCDNSVDLYMNVSVTSSASSASNALTLKHLTLEALN